MQLRIGLVLLLLSEGAWSSSSARRRGFSPAFDVLAAPRRVEGRRDLDLSGEVEPLIIGGLVKERWTLAPELLGGEGTVRVDVWPLDGGPCPKKLENGTMISPALLPVAAG